MFILTPFKYICLKIDGIHCQARYTRDQEAKRENSNLGLAFNLESGLIGIFARKAIIFHLKY